MGPFNGGKSYLCLYPFSTTIYFWRGVSSWKVKLADVVVNWEFGKNRGPDGREH